MSYTTQDRYGGVKNVYAHPRGGGPIMGTGSKGNWWPDFGPSTHDFSAQEKVHPTDTIFHKVVKPFTRSNSEPGPSSRGGSRCGVNYDAPSPQQFRHPAPSMEATLHKSLPGMEERLAAKRLTNRDAHLRRLEMRQRKVDAWLGEEPHYPPVRTAPGGSGSLANGGLPARASLRDLPCANHSVVSSTNSSAVSRDVYERHGYLVGRSRGSIADGHSGVRTRKHNPLSFSTMLFTGELQSNSTPSKRKMQSSKPSKQWHVKPESKFVFDPRLCLPVPRGGWGMQAPSEWPDLEPTGPHPAIANG